MSRNKEAIIAIMLQKEGVERAREYAVAIAGNSGNVAITDDFGHAAINAAGVHIDSWGAGPFKIIVDGETFEFEDSDRFGPVHCEDGEPSGFQFVENGKFWPAWQAWNNQGRRVADDGVTCIWEAPDGAA